MKPERNLPLHLAENTASKCFVFRHSRHQGGRSLIFSYARGKDREKVRAQAIAVANRMNRKLPKPAPSSIEARMSRRNTSGFVGVNPGKTTIRKASGAEFTYFSWKADWVGCPRSGGVAWPCKTHGCRDAYVLAVITRMIRTVERGRVLELLEAIRGTERYRAIVAEKPKHRGCGGR